MPQRVIRDWTDSWTMQQLSSDEERFFVRLMMKADDFGRFHACPNALKSFLFPLLPDIRTEQVRKWRDTCVDVDLISLYRDEKGREFLVINKFGQRLRQMKTNFPAPCGHKDCERLAECKQPGGNLSAECQQVDANLSVETRRNETNRNDSKGKTPPSPDEKPKTGDYTPCEIDLPRSQDEVIEHFERNQAPSWLAEDWFNRMEGCGWIVNGSQIRKWRAAAITKIRYWEADGRPKSREAKVNGAGQSGSQKSTGVNRNKGTANEGLADQYEAFAQQQTKQEVAK